MRHPSADLDRDFNSFVELALSGDPCFNSLLRGASSRTTLVQLPGGPVIGKVRDRASVEGSGSAGEHLPTASIIEGAARELGKGFEIERRVSGSTQGRAGKVPKLAADSRAAVSWKDVDNIDLDVPRNVLPTRWTAADEPHHLVRDRGDHVESVCSLQ
jgi:hypothetical protein